jgi:hypothetical protein
MKQSAIKSFVYLLYFILFLQSSAFAFNPELNKVPYSQLKRVIVEKLKSSPSVELDLFVMSMCPYGVSAEKAIIPIVKQMGRKIKLNLFFIANQAVNGFESLHGDAEILEDRRQLVIARHFPASLLEYLLYRSSDYTAGDWTIACKRSGLDLRLINELIYASAEVEAFRKNLLIGETRKIFASPTLFINGKAYTGSFDPLNKKPLTLTCRGGATPGVECNTSNDCPDACVGGATPGAKCVTSLNCPDACVGGLTPGAPCVTSVDCPGTNGFCRNKGRCIDRGTCRDPLPAGSGRCCIFDTNGTLLACNNAASPDACRTSSGGNTFDYKANSICAESPCITGENAVLAQVLSAIHEDDSSMTLSWQITVPETCNGFYVERSRDGTNFKKIGFVETNKGSLIGYKYSFKDINPYLLGYYRLKWVTNGQLYTSQNVVAIFRKRAGLLLAPNPTSGKLSLFIDNLQLSDAKVIVYDFLGRQVLSRVLRSGQFELDVSKLSNGSYNIRVIHGDRTYTGKFVKN